MVLPKSLKSTKAWSEAAYRRSNRQFGLVFVFRRWFRTCPLQEPGVRISNPPLHNNSICIFICIIFICNNYCLGDVVRSFFPNSWKLWGFHQGSTMRGLRGEASTKSTACWGYHLSFLMFIFFASGISWGTRCKNGTGGGACNFCSHVTTHVSRMLFVLVSSSFPPPPPFFLFSIFFLSAPCAAPPGAASDPRGAATSSAATAAGTGPR